jgi:hypothetical protein
VSSGGRLRSVIRFPFTRRASLDTCTVQFCSLSMVCVNSRDASVPLLIWQRGGERMLWDVRGDASLIFRGRRKNHLLVDLLQVTVPFCFIAWYGRSQAVDLLLQPCTNSRPFVAALWAKSRVTNLGLGDPSFEERLSLRGGTGR